jgi:DNA modification methylase
MIQYQRRDGRLRLLVGDSRRLAGLREGSVGVILTSPPYWVRGGGRAAAERYARELAVGFGRQWKRVLAPGGDLWLILGDRHDGREWIGIDELVSRWFRRAGWALQAKGLWAQTRPRERWDNCVNYLLRFRRAGHAVRPKPVTLCWMLPLPRTHPDSLWDATPKPVIRGLLALSRQRGAVLDPFAGQGTVGEVAAALGREWIGVERDPHMAAVAAQRLGLRCVPPVRAGDREAPSAARRAGR